jgi:acetoin utilization deacetylase AcuC-like enzyme
MTLLIRDPLFLEHDTGRHPECPQRLLAIDEVLNSTGLAARCRSGTFKPLTEEETTVLHSPIVAKRIHEACARGGGYLDADTPVSSRSLQVALAAAGAACSAVDAVLDGVERNALCLVRPPGHHATPTRSMGFCLFNNVALAAQRALSRGLTRILLVDWDVHHGNGTQDLFYADPRVTFFSIHRFGQGFYPGTGDQDETGTGPGLGTTFNAPLPYGTAVPDYHAAFRHFLHRAADLCKPELVVVSAGFDAHYSDPIGSLGLDIGDFVTLTQEVLEVARTHAGGRLVSCLEGGYNLQALAQGVAAHLETLLSA